MNFENSNLETKIFMQQHDCLTANLILPKSYNKVAINKFLQENYLDENGIIDSKKIITDFPSFDKIDELISKQQKVDFSKLDNPDENIVLSAEAKSRITTAIAIDKLNQFKSLNSEEKEKFLTNFAKKLEIEKSDLISVINDDDAVAKLSFIFLQLEDKDLVKLNMNNREEISAFRPSDLSLEKIQQYCDNIDFHGVMAVDDGKGNKVRISNYDKGNQEDPHDRSFATHSVSKLIGGVVICKLIADDVIKEEVLDEKLQLSEEVRKALPKEILKHLEDNNVTLRDVMTHKSGLGGYLDPEDEETNKKLGYGTKGYSGYVREQLEKGEEVKVPESPQDYLQYSERKTYPYGEKNYSDLGIMLASLSAEYLYNKDRDPSEYKSFEDIVREQLTIPAGVENFSAKKPEGAICHSDDPIAPYITGTAGCGYFTNLDGLVKIGKEINEMWHKDEKFRNAIKNYGEEFYNKEKQVIRHPGGIDSSETFLAIDCKSGSVIATEERRIGSHFPYPGLGIITTVYDLNKEEEQITTKYNFFQEIILKDKKAKEAEDAEVSWVKRIEKNKVSPSKEMVEGR